MKMLMDYAETVRNCGPVPPAIYEAVQRYVEQGIMPGGFTQACLENDFKMAVLRADMTNIQYLKPIALMLANAVPSIAHGNEYRVRTWLGGGWSHADKFAEVYKDQPLRAD